MKKFIKFIISFFVWILAVLSLCVVAGVYSWFYLNSPMTKDEDDKKIEKIHISSGRTVRQVARELKEKSFIKNADFFYYICRFSIYSRNNTFSLKSGTYNISNTMNLKEIYNLLQSGAQEYITVSIPEGLTITKIARHLEESEVCSAESFIRDSKNSSYLEKYKIPAESFEGYIFPDTYFMTKDMDSSEVLFLMADNFFKKIETIPELSSLDSISLHDKIILASVIEREYKVQDEAPLISSVFTNRLKHNIGLYSCATIEYIITEIQGLPHPERITYNDLKIDSPYNTYKWAGLPYGPISNPGLVALNAAAKPAQTDYYYFVLTDSQNGRHTFSKNFDQHKAADYSNYLKK